MKTVYLAPSGNDGFNGNESDPVATLARAVELARQAGPGPRRIRAAGGAYFDATAELTEADSGLAIEAAEGQAPIFHGGRRVTGWRREGSFWVADLPGVKERLWDFRGLVVNGRYAPRARFPETGSLRHESEFPVRWMSTTKGGWERKPTEEELTTLRFKPGTLPDSLDPANAELMLYHSWDMSLVGLAALDLKAGLARFSAPAGHPPGAFGNWKEQARTFVVWNTREGLARPGQWYLDRSAGRLVYWPLPEETLASAEIIAPARTVILRLRGTPEAPVRDVTLRGLVFTATTPPLQAGGFGASQIEGALHGEHLDGIRLANVSFIGTGGWAAKLLKAARVEVDRVSVRQAGAGGLAVSGGPGSVRNTRIEHVGLTFPSAIGLTCHGKDWAVAHNELHHTPYSAITGGGENLRFEHNRFHHIMQELVDGASIYVFAGKRCRVAGNVTHSVRDEQVHAYYLDEQCEDSVVEGNLAVDVPWPLHMHMARRGVIRNNVCVNAGSLALSLHNCDGFIVEGNILSAGGKLLISSSYTGIAELQRNVFWSASGEIRWDWHDRLPSLERNAGPVPLLPRHADTLVADPRLVVLKEGQADWGPDSPAAALGLEPLDLRRAGLEGIPGCDGEGSR